jgi:hypothetical protein
VDFEAASPAPTKGGKEEDRILTLPAMNYPSAGCASKTNFLNRINVIALSGKSAKFCQAPFTKIFWFSERPNQFYSPAIPPRQKGRFAIVTDVGAGCGGREAARTNAADADG